MKFKRFLFCVLCVFPCFCFAQQKWEEYILQMAEETENSAVLENLYDDLSYLSQHPYNLNAVTREQLKSLPFLSDIQADRLIEYIRRYGPMQTIYELRLVPELDRETIELLLDFVYAGKKEKTPQDFKIKELLHGKNELTLRYDRCLNEKAGYKSAPDDSETAAGKNYLGEPFYASLRYNYRYKNNLQIGLTAEKDAGEMFWKKEHKGFDFYSGYVLLKNINRLNALALGNYRLSFGQGLVLNTDFNLGKSAEATSVDKRTSGVKPHSSTNESNYLQGIASSFQLNKVNFTLFYSTKKIDANVDNEANTILSIKTDGLHRTENDLDKKNTARINALGSSVNWTSGRFSVGINFLHYQFDKPLYPEAKPYNVFYFRGKENFNVSTDYRFRLKNINFFGETALSKNNALATINGLQFEIESYCRLSFLYRYYDKKYQAFFANAFSESSSVQNEQGVYMGAELQPFGKLRFNFYADYFSFPWLKYGVNGPSKGFEGFVQTTYTFNRNMNMFLYYKYKAKETNTPSKYLNDEHFYPLATAITHKLRYQCNYQINSFVKSKTLVDYCLRSYEKISDKSAGYLLSQEITCQTPKKKMEASVQVAYFDTDDYDSRVYLYERNVLYAFSIPSYYGNGIRSVFNFRYHINKRISCWIRFANVLYFDRDTIGSDLETIDGKAKNDISCLIRLKF